MQFFKSLLIGASAFASFVAAQSSVIQLNNVPAAVTAGQTYDITYTAPAGQPVTILLRQGPSGNLNTISTLTTTSTGGTYKWTVDKNLFNSDSYALEIRQGSEVNYSKQFPLTGGSGSSPVSSSAAPSTTAVSTASSARVSTSVATITSSTAVNSSTLITISSTRSSNLTSTIQTPSSSSMRTTVTHSTPTSTPGSPSSPTGPAPGTPSAPGTGAAANLKSPVALVLCAIAALAYLQ